MIKVVIKILQGIAVTRTVHGGLIWKLDAIRQSYKWKQSGPFIETHVLVVPVTDGLEKYSQEVIFHIMLDIWRVNIIML